MIWKRVLLFFLYMLPLASGAATLNEAMMERSAIEELFRPYLQFDSSAAGQQQQFLNVLPYANQLSLIRTQLRTILESYSYGKDQDYSFKMLQILDSSFPEKGDAIDIHFENSNDRRFQVEGIETDRLAINTGTEIVFNVQGLLKRKDFSLADAVQLWLHELSHFDKSTPLEARDQWASQVAQWVRECTTEIQLEPNHKLMALLLPDRPTAHRDIHVNPLFESPLDMQIRNIQKSFVLLDQNSKGTRYYEPAYQSFLTFNSSIRRASPTWDRFIFRGNLLTWPVVSVQSVKLLPNNTIQINYEQQSIPFKREVADGPFVDQRWIREENIRPIYPTTKFRMEIDPATESVDLKRNYGSQTVGQFDVYRIEDHNSKRFVSIRLKLENFASTILNPSSLHLLGRNEGAKELLSFNVKSFRILNKDEVLLHFEVPQRNIEISQILIPQPSDSGTYREDRVLPAQPFSLYAKSKSGADSTSVGNLEIQEKQTPNDSVRASLRIQTDKKVAGVTLDMEHSLLFLESSGTQRGYSNDLAVLGEGRKYFIHAKDLSLKNSTLSFGIPETKMQQWGEGPEMTKQITWAYTKRFRIKAETVRDTQYRSIKALWVHFTDGTVARLPHGQLPQESFSLNFTPENIRVFQCKDIFN